MTIAAAKSESRRFASFVLTGGIAAAVNLAVRWGLSMTMRYELAVGLAYLAGMTTAFVLARRYVFAREDDLWAAKFGRFAIVNVASFLVVLGVSVGLARYVFPSLNMTWHPDDVAHVIGVISPIGLSYYAHKFFSFRAE